MKNMSNLNFKIILFSITFFVLLFKVSNGVENKILFKLNNKSYTSLDLENRKKYLSFIGDNLNIDEEVILDDFISSLIFYEYYLATGNNINFESKLIELFNNISNENIKNNNQNNITIDNDNIMENLKTDYVRKNILEEIISTKKNEIFNEEDEYDLLYNYNIKYINIYISELEKKKEEVSKQKFNNINEIIQFLDNNQIPFFKKEEEINDLSSVNNKIKKNIISNINFFNIQNNNLLTFIYVEKKFETLDGLIANIYSVETNEELDSSYLKCENIKKINKENYKIISKEYEFNKLNNEIKNKLINVNDLVKYKSNDKTTYVVLCGIKFDRDLLNNININKKINLTVNKVEKKFIKKYSKKYNLIKLYE